MHAVWLTATRESTKPDVEVVKKIQSFPGVFYGPAGKSLCTVQTSRRLPKGQRATEQRAFARESFVAQLTLALTS